MQVIHLIIIGSILLIIEIYFLFFKPNLKKHSIFAIIITFIIIFTSSLILDNHIKNITIKKGKIEKDKMEKEKYEKWKKRYDEAVEELNSNS